MVGLEDIPRTASFAWSPGSSQPFIATGTKAGAVDEGFSNDAQLELWRCELGNSCYNNRLEPAAAIETDSRFNDISWTKKTEPNTRGIIAGALENGALDLWDADRLLTKATDPLLSRTVKHSGAIKALQFNAYRSDLLATVGVKGELFISDLNNVANPFRMGNAVARADDFDCLDWNKKSPHILVTGSSGGTMTVWDIKNKRESLTLNNMGRKPVSAVAWDPAKATRLATAIPSDTEPLILVWDLRNANAPEQTLRGHDKGVLSLSWCSQDSGLLLSCGKDSRTFCWNPQTGDCLGEFPVVTNWTFQTRWNPSNPAYMATASFDGHISINTIQNTVSGTDIDASGQLQIADDDDFFNKAQIRPQLSNFSLNKAPHWLQRPCGATFGFGGKIVSFGASSLNNLKRSSVRISSFAIDDGVSSLTKSFEDALEKADLQGICERRIAETRDDKEKADWRVIKTLTSDNTRKELIDHLSLCSIADLPVNKMQGGDEPDDQGQVEGQGLGTNSAVPSSNRLSAFFDNGVDGENFLAELAATKGAKTNNPFHIYPGSESISDRKITHALILGKFDEALAVCLQERRMADAFMIAICGGTTCVEQAQKAYFGQKDSGPNYLRLLASVVTKNLWDLVHNADLEAWKDVMATLCTYADAKEFPDLCEALGDRIEERSQNQEKDDEAKQECRQNATFCYLAGSKLEKVVRIWTMELAESEAAGLNDLSQGSSFSVHARSIQSFIEKVTVFREVTSYHDENEGSNENWKLAALYDKYIEYADIATAHGQMQVAERYLNLLPNHYAASDVAKSRIRYATQRSATLAAPEQNSTSGKASQRNGGPDSIGSQQSQPHPLLDANPETAHTEYNRKTKNSYTPSSGPYAAPLRYQQGQSTSQNPPPPQPGLLPPSSIGSLYQNQHLGPPPRGASPASIAPPKTNNQSNWNDIPEGFAKAPSLRRGTPVPNMTPSYQPSQMQQPANAFAPPTKSTPPLGPPPKGSVGPSPTETSQRISNPYQPQDVPEHSAPNASVHALQQAHLAAPPQQTPIARGPSPYNAPPPSAVSSISRYAPTQSLSSIQSQQGTPTSTTVHQPPPSNPYAPQQQSVAQQKQVPLSNLHGPISTQSSEKSSSPLHADPISQQGSGSNLAQSQVKVVPKHPPGDRSHIPAMAQPIFSILQADMQRVKARAPTSFKAQVIDTEKRLGLLFDHLNNEDLLSHDTISSMLDLTDALSAKTYDRAQMIHKDIITNKAEECGNWMIGVKRLIAMSRATP